MLRAECTPKSWERGERGKGMEKHRLGKGREEIGDRGIIARSGWGHSGTGGSIARGWDRRTQRDKGGLVGKKPKRTRRGRKQELSCGGPVEEKKEKKKRAKERPGRLHFLKKPGGTVKRDSGREEKLFSQDKGGASAG